MSRPQNVWNDDPEWVDASTIREKFNAAQVWERAKRRELIVQIKADRHPARPLAREPFCTRSQILAFLTTDGKPVALAHLYQRPDGTVGLSGRPDPVRLYDGSRLLAKRTA